MMYGNVIVSKCKEVGTTFALCYLIRSIPYYHVWVLYGTAIPASILQLFFILVYIWPRLGSRGDVKSMEGGGGG